MTRRQYLAATGAGLLAVGFGPARPALALDPLRQGFQTNIWGMPTYYLMRSGYLEKHGLKFEEFAVPSGNLTMQQMVARQVDLGTYAAQSLILGHDKGGMVGIAVIENVGRTAAVLARKDLNITRLEQLRGLKIGNQVGASTGNIFADTITTSAGLMKGDWQEVRMNVNDMVAALAAKTIDAAACVEPYNAIAVADGIATVVTDYSGFDTMPVFMEATPDFVARSPDTIVAYLKAWLDVARDFKQDPAKVTQVIHAFYTDKGYNMSPDTLKSALATVDVNPGFPTDLTPYMQAQADILLRAKKIAAIPDWKKALRPEFMERARVNA
jgi:ABC-type nitrate/sulfonate/bicarbonate transport system substrate-binding protein